MSARPLAEVIEEGRRLAEAARQAQLDGLPTGVRVFNARLTAHYRQHGPRLLAVAGAAVEWREAEQRMDKLCRESQAHCRCVELAVTCDRCRRATRASEEVDEMRAAFDAAVRGAK